MALYDSFSEWQHASSVQREQAARRLVQALPKGFAFDAVHLFEFNGRQFEIAQFTLGAARFSLIPGNTIQLGFDAAGWAPTPDMVESWQDTARDYGIEEPLHDYVNARTREKRIVTLAPLLVETCYAEVGWKQIDPASATVQALLRKFPQGVTSYDGVVTRITVANNGNVIAEQPNEADQTHAAIAKNFAEAGFRFPTPDEWEYLCGTGTPTLFRWGDHVPCDRYPTDLDLEEDAWGHQSVLEDGHLGHSAADFPKSRNFHCDPNAFGLYIASDPYKLELTTEAGLTRGGDGGGTICGGAGFLVGWLPLASAWNDRDSSQHERSNQISIGYSVARRVFPLA